MNMSDKKTVVLAPDSFKGTLSSPQVCTAMAKGIKAIRPDLKVVATPIADGGEGTMECFFTACGGEMPEPLISDPYFNPIRGRYALLKDGTAVIEMAVAAGLPLVGENKNPALTTTFGVGELIKAAIQRGATKIVLALGGSATNDGGAGMAVAMGAKFFDANGKEFVPVGESLKDICRIDIANLKALIGDIPVTVMCDVTNPLCGENGAAFIYAPQKGADEKMVKELDAGLLHFAQVIISSLKLDISEVAGAGAAGGMGGGAIAFLNGRLVSGIDVILDTVGFDKLLEDALLVITGEGRVDGQSASGKAIAGVTKRATSKNVPTVVIAGDIGENVEALYSIGVKAILSTNRVAAPYQEQRKRAASDIELTTQTLLRIMNI